MNRVRRERIVLLSIGSTERPRVPDEERVTVIDLGSNVFRVVAMFGFMEQPRIDAILKCAASRGLVIEADQTDFYVTYDLLRATGDVVGMASWRKRLFALLYRLSPPMVESLGIPARRDVLLGRQVEI